MGNPYFNRDESIILTAHKVHFNSAMSDVMLTNQRLILIDAGYAQFKPQTIPLSTLETVITGEDTHGNPSITLALSPSTPGGATQAKELIFSQQTAGERKQERDEWVKRLKELVSSVRREAILPGKTLTEQETDIIFDDTIPQGTGRVPAGPVPGEMRPALRDPVVTPLQSDAGTKTWADKSSVDTATPAAPASGESSAGAGTQEPQKISLSDRFHPAPPAGTGKPRIITVAAIFIVVLAIAGGMFIYSNSLPQTPYESPGSVSTQQITSAPTPVPTTLPPVQTLTTVQTLTPIVTPIPTSQPQVIIPTTGVWVRVQYAGKFTGTVGLSGGMRKVDSSGDQFYQIPTIDGMVKATIQKQDGSGNVLVIEIYKNGQLVKRSTLSSPMGTLDLSVDLKNV
jgi:hypothetical protein